MIEHEHVCGCGASTRCTESDCRIGRDATCPACVLAAGQSKKVAA